MNNKKELDDLHCIQIHLTNNNECIIQAISNKNINDIKLSKAKPLNSNNQNNKIKNEDLNLNNLNYLNNIESDDLMNLSITQNDLNSTSQKNIKNKNINYEHDENSDNIIINFSELLESINSNDNLNLKTNSIIINKELTKNKLNNLPICKNLYNTNSENTKNNDNITHDLVNKFKEYNYLSYRNSNINSGRKTPLKYIKKQFNNKNENEKEKEKEKINLNKKIINNEDIQGKNLLNNFNHIQGNNNNNKNTNDCLMANKNIKSILNKDLNILYNLNENKNSNNLNNILINKVKIGNKNILNGKINSTQKNAISINDEKKITVNRVNSYKSKNNKNSKVKANLFQNKKIKVKKNLENNKIQIKINNNNGAKRGGKSKQRNIMKNKPYISIPTKKINFAENFSIKKKNSNDDTKKKNNILNWDNLDLNNFLKILKKKININKNKSDSKNISENNKDSKSIEGSYFYNNNYNNNNKKVAIDASNRKKSNDDKKNIFIKSKISKSKNRSGKNIFIRRYPFIQYKYKTIDNNNSNSNCKEFNSYIKNKSIFYNNNLTLTKNKNNSFNKSLTSRNTSNKKKQKSSSRKISLRTKEFNKFFEIKEIKEKYSEEKSYIPKTTKNNSDTNTLKKSKSGKNAIKPKINIFNKILKKNNSHFGKTKNKMMHHIKNKIINIDTETKKFNKNKETKIKNKKISKISNEKTTNKNLNEFKTENYNKETFSILGYGNLTERINTNNRKRNNMNEEETSLPSNNNFNGTGKNTRNNYMNTITYKSTNNINTFFNLIKPKEIIQNFSNYKKKKDNN